MVINCCHRNTLIFRQKEGKFAPFQEFKNPFLEFTIIFRQKEGKYAPFQEKLGEKIQESRYFVTNNIKKKIISYSLNIFK